MKQLAEIRRRVLGMLARAQNHWKNKLAPELAKRHRHPAVEESLGKAEDLP